VAGLPLDSLTGQAEEIARAWSVALIVARPLSAIADIPLEDLAQEAPRLCAQMLRALESDAELESLTASAPDGGREEPAASKLARLAGARDVASVVAAVEALRGVLWDALLAELRAPVVDRSLAHLLTDLADRLAYVCAMTLAAALPPAVAHDQGIAGHRDVIVAGAESPPVPPRRAPVAPQGPGSSGEVVIIDERPQASSSARLVVARETRKRGDDGEGETAPSWDRPATRYEPLSSPSGSRASADSRPEPVPDPVPPQHSSAYPDTPAVSLSEPPEDHGAGANAWTRPRPNTRAAPVEIEIRDERVEEGPAAWIRSIGRELERFALDGRPFAVLLIELMEAERLHRSAPPDEWPALAAEVERTLRAQLRSTPGRQAGSLTREAPGRFWLLAPEVDAAGAGALAERLEHAVRQWVSYRGRPLEIAVGTAICPQDGVQAAALAAHADVGLYAARLDRSAGGGAAS
jgi:GGDEF domain-containing protein